MLRAIVGAERSRRDSRTAADSGGNRRLPGGAASTQARGNSLPERSLGGSYAWLPGRAQRLGRSFGAMGIAQAERPIADSTPVGDPLLEMWKHPAFPQLAIRPERLPCLKIKDKFKDTRELIATCCQRRAAIETRRASNKSEDVVA